MPAKSFDYNWADDAEEADFILRVRRPPLNPSITRDTDVYDNLGRNKSAQERRQNKQAWVLVYRCKNR